MNDNEKEQQDDDAEANEDLELGDEADDVAGGLRNPDAGGHLV